MHQKQTQFEIAFPIAAMVPLLGFLTYLGCGGDPAIIITIEQWPSGAEQLRVRTSLNGTVGKDLFVAKTQSRFVIRLPVDAEGTALLDVVGLDSIGCTVASGSLTESVPGGVRHFVEDVLTLTPQIPPLCPPPPKIDGENCSQIPSDPTCKSGCCLQPDDANLDAGSVCTGPRLQVWQDWHANCRFIFLDGGNNRIGSDIVPGRRILKLIPGNAVAVGITDCAPPGFGIQGIYLYQTQSKPINTSSCQGSWIPFGPDMILRCMISNQ